MKSDIDQLHEKWFGEPMSDEVRRLAEERSKMTPQQRREDIERISGFKYTGDQVEDEDF